MRPTIRRRVERRRLAGDDRKIRTTHQHLESLGFSICAKASSGKMTVIRFLLGRSRHRTLEHCDALHAEEQRQREITRMVQIAKANGRETRHGRRGSGGYGLVELLVALAVLATVMAVVVTVLVQGIGSYTYGARRVMNQQDVRWVTEKTARLLRNARDETDVLAAMNEPEFDGVLRITRDGRLFTIETTSADGAIRVASMAMARSLPDPCVADHTCPMGDTTPPSVYCIDGGFVPPPGWQGWPAC
jgi:hypothetical protein